MSIARPSPLKPKLFVAGATVVAIAVFAMLLPSAAVAQQGGTGGLVNGGVLLLHLGSSGAAPQDYLGFRSPDGTGGYNAISQKQSITNGSGCRIALGTVPTAADQLVTFTPATASGSNPQVGFVSDGIGVGQSGEGNGQPCGRIDKPPGQTLTMNLGSSLGGKLIDYAEIDVELKFTATLKVTGYINGTAVGAPETYSSVGSDSGPDSADGDNYRIRFPKSGTTLVNQLKFEIDTTGGASLEGGADGTAFCDPADPAECGDPPPPGDPVNFSLGQTLGTTDSLFHLINADGVLNCGDSTGPQGGNGSPSFTLERLANDTGICSPIPYDLESGAGVTPGCAPGSPQCILLLKDLFGQAAQFYWTVTWTPETADYPETPTQFDIDLDGTFLDLQPCLADADVPPDGLPELPPTADETDDPSLVDPWCVTDTSTDFDIATGLQTVTETYFGGGDPGGKR